MLYELRPDLLPEGYLTDCELILWGSYFEERGASTAPPRRHHG
jgi:hypothetical protein